MLKRFSPNLQMSFKQKKSVLFMGAAYSRTMATANRYKYDQSRQSFKYKSFDKYKMMFLASSLFTFGYLLNKWRKHYGSIAEWCGIIGYIGNENIAEKVILDGIQILQYRGYDSWGIVTVDSDNNFVVHKKSSSSGQGGDWIESVLNSAKGQHAHLIGIGHTRWATHGGKTDLNAHPHFDLEERFAVVHNGMIENFQDIRQLLKEKGIEQRTQLIALYTKYLVDTEGLSTENASISFNKLN